MEDEEENIRVSEVQFSDENVPLEENGESSFCADGKCVSENGRSGGERLEKAGRFLMTMQYVCGVNQNKLDTVIKETEILVDFVYNDIVEKFSNLGFLKPGCGTNSVKQEVCAVFDGLRSKWYQDKYLKESLQVIQPRCVSIDAKFLKKGESQKRKVAIMEKNFFYIPVLEVLEKLVKHPDFEVITQRKCSPDADVLDCYTKGNLFKNNPFFVLHPDALRLLLYYDDAEFCKDLSSRAGGSQKLGCLYLTLDNIDPLYRGNLDTIWLLGFVNSHFVKEHGLGVVLERVRADVEELEEGVVLNDKETFGTMIGISGDNLGAHEAGGFKCGFTANCPCRTCEMKLSDLRVGATLSTTLLRTPERYNMQVEELNSAKTMKERQQKSTEYGIDEACALNGLSHFHAVHGLPPHPMHDLLEGSLLRGVKHIVKHCVVDCSLVSLDWLNSAMEDMDYGYR